MNVACLGCSIKPLFQSYQVVSWLKGLLRWPACTVTGVTVSGVRAELPLVTGKNVLNSPTVLADHPNSVSIFHLFDVSTVGMQPIMTQ